MKLPSVVRFADDRLKTLYYSLEQGDDADRELFAAIEHVMDILEVDAYAGIRIRRSVVPKILMRKHDIANLWKYDLPKGWRLLYSIVNEEVLIVSLILEWLSHKEYGRMFRY